MKSKRPKYLHIHNPDGTITVLSWSLIDHVDVPAEGDLATVHLRAGGTVTAPVEDIERDFGLSRP